MKTAALLLAAMLFGGLQAAERQPQIKRLDGSSISSVEIDGEVLRLMHAAEATGAGISLFDHGKAVFSKTCGFRDVQKERPLTEDSAMGGASFTKVAFAYLVMQLVDSGILDLAKDPRCRESGRGCC
jgi:CubicO group peptidase (beta-lactamase class C family)